MRKVVVSLVALCEWKIFSLAAIDDCRKRIGAITVAGFVELFLGDRIEFAGREIGREGGRVDAVQLQVLGDQLAALAGGAVEEAGAREAGMGLRGLGMPCAPRSWRVGRGEGREGCWG